MKKEAQGLYYRRRQKAAVLVLLLVLLASIVMIDFRIKKSLLELAQTQAEIRTVEIVTRAVYEQLGQATEYNDIVHIHKDDQGRIVMLQANTVILNRYMALANKAILAGLKQANADQIKIPLGQITGITLLAGRGPRLGVRVMPASQVFIEVDDRFEEAGINQTRHRIYMKVKTRIKIAVPLMGKEILVVSTIPMTETVIVGDVPQTYVSLKGAVNPSADVMSHSE